MTVFDGLNACLDDRKITVVLGRSGCGKTTLLRILLRLEEKDGGEIVFERPGKLGAVFQEPRLMPWLTVRQNILFGVPKREWNEAEFAGLLALTGLEKFSNAYPHQLSGGMQQRVALARALAYHAGYLLMDEPFAALDYFTRQSMQQELLRIHREGAMGVLFVTHSVDEALVLGDSIIILEQGKVAASYHIDNHDNPRDLLSADMIEIKRSIMENIHRQ